MTQTQSSVQTLPNWSQAAQALYQRLHRACAQLQCDTHTNSPPSASSNPQLYAIVDSAASESIATYLATESNASEAMCVYDGQAAIKFAHVAPYVFKIHPHSAVAAHWFSQGWDKHWGIVLASRLDIKALKTHLKKFIQVDTPEGLAYWRFYDPRVLNPLLAMMTPAQTGAFMGVAEQTVDALYTRNNDGTLLQHTAYQSNALIKFTKTCTIKSVAIA